MHQQGDITRLMSRSGLGLETDPGILHLLSRSSSHCRHFGYTSCVLKYAQFLLTHCSNVGYLLEVIRLPSQGHKGSENSYGFHKTFTYFILCAYKHNGKENELRKITPLKPPVSSQGPRQGHSYD